MAELSRRGWSRAAACCGRAGVGGCVAAALTSPNIPTSPIAIHRGLSAGTTSSTMKLTMARQRASRRTCSGNAKRKSCAAKADSSAGSAKVPVTGCIARFAVAASRSGSCSLRGASFLKAVPVCFGALATVLGMKKGWSESVVVACVVSNNFARKGRDRYFAPRPVHNSAHNSQMHYIQLYPAIFWSTWVIPRHPISWSGKLSVQKRSKKKPAL